MEMDFQFICSNCTWGNDGTVDSATVAAAKLKYFSTTISNVPGQATVSWEKNEFNLQLFDRCVFGAGFLSLTEIHYSHVLRIPENVLNDTKIYGVFTLLLTRIPNEIKLASAKKNGQCFVFFLSIFLFCLNSNVFRNTQNSVNGTLIINHKQMEENVKISFKFFIVNVKFVSIQVNFIYVFFFFLSLYFVEICRTQ